MMKLNLFFFSLLIHLVTVLNVHGQIVSPTKKGEMLFAMEVKQIDEFIERFNNAEHTAFKKYMQDEFEKDEWKRSDLIISLFDQETDWEVEQIQQFLADVTESAEPPYLDFYDENWFAEVSCLGNYKGKERNFTLVLKIEKIPTLKATKWVIESVRADFLKLPPSQDTKRALNPASYGTDFMGLFEALSDTKNLNNYISKNNSTDDVLPIFFHEIHQGNLQYIQVNNINYHFLQIPEWFFRVKYHRRESENSGWLISELIKMDDKLKEKYQSDILLMPANKN